jgi:uncharacterized membrane protein
MASTLVGTAIYFLIGWIISTLIIYVVTKLFEEEEGFGTALMAALVGTVVYALVYYFLGSGFLPGLIAGIVWLLALMWLYEMKFLRALVVAIIVWILAIVVGWFLPTLGGPF